MLHELREFEQVPIILLRIFLEFPFYFIWDWIFYMVINLLITVYALPMCILTSLSIDVLLLPSYTTCSTNFRGLPIIEDMAPSWLKHKKTVLSEFM